MQSKMCPEKLFTMTSALKNNVSGNNRCPEKLFTMIFCGSFRASRGRQATRNTQSKRCPEKLFTMTSASKKNKRCPEKLFTKQKVSGETLHHATSVEVSEQADVGAHGWT